MKLAIVTSRWGQPTETFVRREADAALRAGNAVLAISLKPPVPVASAIPVVHLRPIAAVGGVMRTTARHPVRVVTGLWRVVTRSAPRNLPATIAAWAIGTACASKLPRVDWIQAHFAWVAATAADALSGARGQEYSVFAHAHDIFEAKLADRYTRDKLQRAALVLVESPSIAEEVHERFGCRPLVQRMGVAEEDVVSEPATPVGRRVLSVGSLVPKKGHDDLIRAVARIEDCDLQILGEGPQRPELEALIDTLGCGQRVTLAGAVEPGAVLDRLRDSAAFCLASKPSSGGDRDGVPNVLIEAMARGVPVISTRLSGIPDLVGVDRGLLVEPGSVDQLEEAIRSTLDDSAASSSRASAALAHIRACYTTEANWAELQRRITERLAG